MERTGSFVYSAILPHTWKMGMLSKKAMDRTPENNPESIFILLNSGFVTVCVGPPGYVHGNKAADCGRCSSS